MLKKRHFTLTLPALGLAAWLLSPGLGIAQHRGGHRGGFHAGGFHAGGFRHAGGFYHGEFRGRNFGFGGFGFRPWYGLGLGYYPWYYPGYYGYYPGSYGYYPGYDYYGAYGPSSGGYYGAYEPHHGSAELGTYPPSPEEKSMGRLLSASGVANDKGQLRWPIGLAILAAPGADEFREQIDALFDEAARQAADGSVNPALAEEVRQAGKKLRRLLLKEKAERLGMPLAVYQESERFLDKLDRAEQLFRAGGQRRSRTEGSSTSDSTGSHK
jgi:hypothetical protein